jgi:excisionase family DNA binding protein
MTLAEAAEYLRTSKWTIYRLLDENQLKSVRIRNRRLIPEVEIERFVAAQLAEGAA